MQTNLRGRDLISLQEWTREEIETVLDVASDLKRKRALGEPHPYLRDKVLAMLFFFSSTRTRASFEAGMAQLGGHAQFIEIADDPDRPRRHRPRDRRDPRPLQRRDRHPQRRLGRRQPVHPRGRRGEPRAGPQHAVRPVPPAPGPGRPADDHARSSATCAAGRSPSPGPTPRATRSRSACPQDLVLAGHPLRHERPAGPPAGVPADGRGRRPRRRENARGRTARSS